MTRDLVLHLGDFKTGSTAIQQLLSQEAAGQGICYPPGFNHAALAQALPDPVALAAELSRIAPLLNASTAAHAVISAEHFEFADPALLASALARHLPGHAPRLIAYVRPHSQALLARFAESTRIGSFDGDLDSYPDWPQTGARLGYATRFGRWRAVFGARFTLRLYDRHRFAGGDIRRDFLQCVTGQDRPLSDTGPVNPTPGLADLALARALHRAIGPLPAATNAARWTLGRHLGRLMAARRTPDTELRLHQSLAQRLLSQFHADAAATDAQFFPGETPLGDALAAAPAQAIPAAQSLAPQDHFDLATRDIIALWGAMLRAGLTSPGGAALLDRLYHE